MADITTKYKSKWTGKEIDDGIEKARNALPLDGSKAMTGAMEIKKIDPRISLSDDYTGGDAFFQASSNRAALQARNDASSNQNRRQLQLLTSIAAANIANALKLTDWVEAASKQYVVFGEHNKPSGSYTGNGSATARTIEVGGIGGVLGISSANGSAIVTAKGAITWSAGTVAAVPQSELSFAEGRLTIATNNTVVNSNGKSNYYQVL